MSDAWSPPPDFHAILVPGMTIHVDDDARREVERWLKSTGESETLDIVSIYDEEITLVRGMVVTMYSTTPETRKHDRAHGKALEAERPIEDRA